MRKRKLLIAVPQEVEKAIPEAISLKGGGFFYFSRETVPAFLFVF